MEKDGTERGTSCTCTHRVRFVRANDGGVFPSAFIGVLKRKPLYGGAAMTCEVAVQFPDGTSRLCLEHKCRPSAALKLVTCTRLCPMRATGGLPSLMMRLRQDGHERVTVVGPTGIRKCLMSVRDSKIVKFLEDHPKLDVIGINNANKRYSKCGPGVDDTHSDNDSEIVVPEGCFSDFLMNDSGIEVACWSPTNLVANSGNHIVFEDDEDDVDQNMGTILSSPWRHEKLQLNKRKRMSESNYKIIPIEDDEDQVHKYDKIKNNHHNRGGDNDIDDDDGDNFGVVRKDTNESVQTSIHAAILEPSSYQLGSLKDRLDSFMTSSDFADFQRASVKSSYSALDTRSDGTSAKVKHIRQLPDGLLSYPKRNVHSFERIPSPSGKHAHSARDAFHVPLFVYRLKRPLEHHEHASNLNSHKTMGWILVIDCIDSTTVSQLPAPLELEDALPECNMLDKENSAASIYTCMVLHFTPPEISKTNLYQRWIQDCPGALHVMMNNSSISSHEIGHESCARTAHVLSEVSSRCFPGAKLPPPRPSFVCGLETCRNVLDAALLMTLSLSAKGWTRSESDLEKSSSISAVEGSRDESHVTDRKCTNINPLMSEILHGIADPGSLAVSFFGTGCSEPSKYRGASSIYIHRKIATMPIDSRQSSVDSIGGILLDCGEGAYGGFVRRFGKKEALWHIGELSCIFISHFHADHCLGLPAIIAARKASPSLSNGGKNLLIIGPQHIKAWLKLMPVELIGNSGLLYCHPSSVTKGPCRAMIEKSCKLSIRCVRVIHCHDAWGCILVLPARRGDIRKTGSKMLSFSDKSFTEKECFRGKNNNESKIKIVYSGDTIPSHNLIKEGYECNLLIHEATYASDRTEMARERRHSTVNQAIKASREMKAQATILTHFSQRYPKSVSLDDTVIESADDVNGLSTEHKSSQTRICTAFDGIEIDFGMLPHLRHLNECLNERLILMKEESEYQQET